MRWSVGIDGQVTETFELSHRRIHPARRVGTGQDSCFGSEARAEVRRPKGRERGWGSRSVIGFLAFWRRQMASRGTCWGQVWGWPLSPPA